MDYRPVAVASAPARRFGAPAALAYALGALPLLSALFAERWPYELASHFVTTALLGVALIALLCALRRRWYEAASGAVIALGYAALCVPLYVPAPALASRGGARLTVLSANLLYRSSDDRPIADLIARTKPDVLVLQELTPRWRAALEPVLAAYPHQHQILSDDAFGIGVYSRSSFEVLDPELDHPPMIAVRLAHAGRVATLLAIHTIPPVNEHAALLRDRQLDHIAKLAKRAQSNVIVAGDLNTTSWSPAFAKMLNASGLVDTRRGFGIQGSWHSSWPAPIRIPIDHILTSSDVLTHHREIAPATSSDHRAVFVELSLH